MLYLILSWQIKVGPAEWFQRLMGFPGDRSAGPLGSNASYLSKLRSHDTEIASMKIGTTVAKYILVERRTIGGPIEMPQG